MVSAVEHHWRNLDPRQFWLFGYPPEAPVAFDESSGMWNVYGYPEVVEALGDTETFSNETARLVPIEGEFSRGNLLKMDPPEHRTLRKLVANAFTSRTVAALEPRIHELTHQLLDEASDGDRLEVVEALTYPLPVIVIAEMLGIPSSDRHLFRRWMGEVFEQPEGFERDAPTADSTRNAVDQMGQLITYLHGHVTDRRAHPREDLLTRLVEAEVDGERLSDVEVANFASVLLIAGHITTTMLLGNIILCLDAFPHVRKELLADRSRTPAAVEEAMRFMSSFAQVTRATNRACSLGGVRIEADQLVLVWVAAANRDPRFFVRPDEFDINRDPNSHLAFGRGVHHCIGTQLARLEGRVATNIFLDRFPHYRVDPDESPRFQSSPYMTGVKRMSVLLEHAPARCY